MRILSDNCSRVLKPKCLQGDVAVLSGGSLHVLVLQHFQIVNRALPGAGRVEDVVDEASLRGNHGVSEPICVLDSLRLHVLVLENNLHSALCPRYSHFSAWPAVVGVSLEVLAGHDVVSASVGLASDNRQFRCSGLGIGVKQLGAIANDTTMLLLGTRKEARHVYEGEDWNVVAIEKPHEPGCLDTCIDIKAASKVSRVVRHNTHGTTIHATNPQIMLCA